MDAFRKQIEGELLKFGNAGCVGIRRIRSGLAMVAIAPRLLPCWSCSADKTKVRFRLVQTTTMLQRSCQLHPVSSQQLQGPEFFISMNIVVDQQVIGFAADHDKRILISRASGVLSRADVFGYIDAKRQAGVLGYAELFDARDIVVDLSISDLPVIGDAMRNSMAGQKAAKMAVVTNSAYIYGLAKRYAEVTKADHPQFKVSATTLKRANG